MTSSHPKIKLSCICTITGASSKAGTSEGISNTLLCSLFQSHPTYHPLLPVSRAADLPPSLSQLRTNIRVSLRSLLSLWGHQGSWQVISCSIITGSIPLTMMMLTYCMCHTIIILKIHSRGKAKTMSVSADARCWWKATQWHFCLCVLTRVKIWSS